MLSLPVASLISRTVSKPRVGSRPCRRRVAPCFAKACASSRPRPLVVPVIKIVRSSIGLTWKSYRHDLNTKRPHVKPINVTVVPGDPDDHASGLFKTLTVTIRRPQSAWQKADAGLTLLNPDGKQASSPSYIFLSTTATAQSPP